MKTTLKTGIAILVVMTLALGCKKEEQKAERTDEAIPVKVVNTAAWDQAQAVQTSGLLASEQEARLSFKTGGIIQSVLVKEGDKVRKGQLLATLNVTEISAQVAQAEENFMKARRDAQRVENLYRDSVATKEQLENTKTALIVAEKQLDIAKCNISQSKIYANTEGVVIKKLQNAGEQASGGAPVLLISSTNNRDWVIRCGLTDRDWARLKGGETAEIHFDAYPDAFKGTVSALAQGSDPASGLYQAEIKVQGNSARLASGLFAKVSVYPKEKTNMLALPVDALIEGENDSASVFVAADNKAERRQVRVAYLQGEKALIASGLEAGAEVIREGSAYLTDGSLIKVIR